MERSGERGGANERGRDIMDLSPAAGPAAADAAGPAATAAAGPSATAAAAVTGGADDMAVDAGDTVAVAGGGGRPGGLRHDNDKDDVADILVVPTADELLCGMPPYLPLPPTSEAGGGAATATEGASAAAAAATDTAGRS